uniref:Fucosyltransferase n=1 Tax=Tetraodon nigroviridis TaxID=99883 RepID=Q6EV16_TETNG|nr:alpha3-fucosyltransferase [Tetraodon nigroviridis]
MLLAACFLSACFCSAELRVPEPPPGLRPGLAGVPRLHRRGPGGRRGNVSILLWHWPFGRPYRLSGDVCQQRYNISNCLLSDDTSTASTADVVVFHQQELGSGRVPLPPRRQRPASQRWVWLSLEPPANMANLSRLNSLFNWTMSFRRDADVPVPYGRTVLGADGRAGRVPLNRSCLVSWVVSKYQPEQARSAFYRSLSRHLPVQVYGRWTRRPLSSRELLPTIAKCYLYLSLENSQARDYISEKLWRNAFQAGAVPVVLGPSRATYQALAPPGSFIHVDDFRSPAALAAHLKRVAADAGAYEQYFSWRRSHRIQTITDWRERLCQICVRYPRLAARKSYRDLEAWVNA